MIKERNEIQKDVVKTFKANNYQGAALVPTGVGKAWIFIQILKMLKPKTVWYLCDSTRNRDITFKAELKKWGAEEYIDRIEFMCYQTAYKRKDEAIELLLADEFDFAMSKEYSKAFSENWFKKFILLSGTLSSKSKEKLDDLCIPIIFKIGISEVEEKGALNKAEYFIVKFMLSKEENKKYLNFNYSFVKLLNRSHYSKKDLEMLQITRKHFLSSLQTSASVCRKLTKYLYDKSEDNKILIFCGLSEQADAVSKHRYHSKVDDESFKLFDKGDIRVISVVSKADRGLNINGVNKIIHESPTKSTTKFSQRTGRGRRLHVQDILEVYFLVPYFKDFKGRIRATIVEDWVMKSAAKLENFNPKTFNLI